MRQGTGLLIGQLISLRVELRVRDTRAASSKLKNAIE